MRRQVRYNHHMLTPDDRKLRVVDSALETLAQGIGNAVTACFPNRTVEEIIHASPSLKQYQAEFFKSAASDPSTMLNVAIDHAKSLGLDVGDLHELRKFRNDVTHKKPTAGARNIALDGRRVFAELTRVALVLRRLNQPSQEASVTRCLRYYVDGAPERWIDPAPDSRDPLDPRIALRPPPRKVRKARKVSTLSNKGLSEDQSKAVALIDEWWRGDKRRFVVAGAAGTGKTRLIIEVFRQLKVDPATVWLVGPTNKACEVMRMRLVELPDFRPRVSTFHKLLYRYDVPPPWDGENPTFRIVGNKLAQRETRLVICDEASMLCDLDVEALESSYRVLYFGDSAQLPAITENREWQCRKAIASTLLLTPDAVLTTIHRQSEGSSINDAAEIIKSGADLQPGLWDDDATRVLDESEGHVDRESFHQLLKDADAVLVARNATRIRLNQIIRDLRGYATFPGDWIPKSGERIVSIDRTQESSFFGQPTITNGQHLIVDHVVRIEAGTNSSTGCPIEIAIVRAHFHDAPEVRGEWPISQEMLVGKHVVGDEVITRLVAGPKSGVLRCDWGYAITVHKAQGSEWNRVLVVDHGGYDKVGARNWNYVALTRARRIVTVVRLSRGSSLIH